MDEPKQPFHKDFDASREDQTFALSDGRVMGFAEYGNPQGIPTFFLHGAPSSRYEGFFFLEAAKKFNLRIICPDRPGHGLSSFQKNRKLSDYPGDIAQLTQHLQLTQFHIIGGSGGGPYVVACAHALPRDQLLTASIVAGIGPPESVTVKNAGWYGVTAMGLMTWVPSVMSWLTKRAMTNEGSVRKLVEKQLRQVARSCTQEDQEKLLSPETLPALIATVEQAYAQGPGGMIRDGQLYTTPWNFKLQDVRMEIKLFYGLKDDRCPPAYGRYYEKHLPNAKLFEYEDATHFTMEDWNVEMLSEIFGPLRESSGSPEDSQQVAEG